MNESMCIGCRCSRESMKMNITRLEHDTILFPFSPFSFFADFTLDFFLYPEKFFFFTRLFVIIPLHSIRSCFFLLSSHIVLCMRYAWFSYCRDFFFFWFNQNLISVLWNRIWMTFIYCGNSTGIWYQNFFFSSSSKGKTKQS